MPHRINDYQQSRKQLATVIVIFLMAVVCMVWYFQLKLTVFSATQSVSQVLPDEFNTFSTEAAGLLQISDSENAAAAIELIGGQLNEVSDTIETNERILNAAADATVDRLNEEAESQEVVPETVEVEIIEP